jgi:hypothetical protein
MMNPECPPQPEMFKAPGHRSDEMHGQGRCCEPPMKGRTGMHNPDKESEPHELE